MSLYLHNVVTLQLDASLCIGCGRCEEVCPHGVFLVAAKKASLLDRDACMECGACMKNCPVAAIQVKAGVGCVTAVINGAITGTEPDCCCGQNKPCC